MFKVLISDKLGADGVEVLEAADDVTVDINTGLSDAELIDIIGDYDALDRLGGEGSRPTVLTPKVRSAAHVRWRCTRSC
ncbi:MAG: hypothetical protein AAFO29_25275, partial [Actinomycetota bacterium]